MERTNLLDTYFDKADYLMQEAEQIPLPESKRPAPSTKWKSLRKLLRQAYSKSVRDCRFDVPLKCSSNVMQDALSTYDNARLLINLFPISDGYSVSYINSDGTSSETMQMPYEENELLEYIDNEQLPPIITNSLHRSHPEAFICGCVICEIRDYRISSDEYSYEVHRALLRPTQQTLNNDVNLIAEETAQSYKWGSDDKLVLESLITLATADPLCLDISPSVAIAKNKMHQRKGRFSTRPMKKLIRKRGALMQKRSQSLALRRAPHSLKLYDFLKERRRLNKQHSQSLSPDVKLPIGIVDVWRKQPLALSRPVEIDCGKILTVPSPDSITSTEIIEVQSIVLESESGNRDVTSRITIGQRPSDMQYFGMLQSNKYFKLSKPDAHDTNQIFTLGTERKANLYILQYHELFTEDGRRPVKVTIRHVNKPPVVYHVPNHQQPWQLSQEKSVYAVGSVTGIPLNKWKRMTPHPQSELKLKLQQQNASQNQKAQQKRVQTNTAPMLHNATLQNTQNVFNASAVRQRVVRTKSIPISEHSVQVLASPQGQPHTGFAQYVQSRSQSLVTASSVPETTRVVVAKSNSNGLNPQTVTINSAALANAIGQIGGTVNVQVPMMTVNAQRSVSQARQTQSQSTPAVIRMPIGMAGNSSSSGQIATLNLIGGSNILTTGSGNISIPASQLPPNIAMQLANLANGVNQQQVSLIPQSSAAPQTPVQPQQISFVNQTGNNAPFTIIANDNWQARDNGNLPAQQHTFTIAPKSQIAPSTRTTQAQPSQPVQLLQQLTIPAHLLNQIQGSSLHERIQIISSPAAAKNQKKRG